jgi:glycosyltransferase involved in cell wall biosynthesis
LDITFIVTDQQKPHEGVVRPFISFAKALESKYDLSFLLLNCSSDFVEHMKKSPFKIIDYQNKKDAIDELVRVKPRFIFTDDDLKRLKFAQEIKNKINAKTISYVQILYGSHSIANCFDFSSLTLKEKLRFTPTKYLPFSFFSTRYLKLLKPFDLVVANSKVTATFLHSLYNVGVSGIVYPSIDTDIFQPRDKKLGREVILYLGSHLGDSRKEFVKKIVAIVTEKGYLVNLFGNAKMASEIICENDKSILYHSNLTDLELAKLYSKSKLTICPQKWEQFGLVPVESISCGTPVLAFNCMGFQETIDTTTGWLANNEADFLAMLKDALENGAFPIHDLRTKTIQNFSIAASGKALEELLEKYFNQKT